MNSAGFAEEKTLEITIKESISLLAMVFKKSKLGTQTSSMRPATYPYLYMGILAIPRLMYWGSLVVFGIIGLILWVGVLLPTYIAKTRIPRVSVILERQYIITYY
jgi:hypothetical protein